MSFFLEVCCLAFPVVVDQANGVGDNGSMKFWDWRSGYCYQAMDQIIQPGSLDSEAGILCSTFDQTGLRLVTGNVDKSIHIYAQDVEAVCSPLSSDF
jgi:pleiotropic regulator 1